jgi:hypothetical protein
VLELQEGWPRYNYLGVLDNLERKLQKMKKIVQKVKTQKDL